MIPACRNTDCLRQPAFEEEPAPLFTELHSFQFDKASHHLVTDFKTGSNTHQWVWGDTSTTVTFDNGTQDVMDLDMNSGTFAATQAVPEPATLALAMAGLVGIGLASRRARSREQSPAA